MNDEPPYIIVDGHKFAPILRIPQRVAVPLGLAEREAPPFGVVDQVTISRAAREKCRQSQSAAVQHLRPLTSGSSRQRMTTYDASARLSLDKT